MSALTILALEAPALAASIWSVGAIFFYGSKYVETAEAWLNGTHTASVVSGTMEDGISAGVVTTAVIEPRTEVELSISMPTSDRCTTSNSKEPGPIITTVPTDPPEVWILVNGEWAKQPKITKAEATTKRSKSKSPHFSPIISNTRPPLEPIHTPRPSAEGPQHFKIAFFAMVTYFECVLQIIGRFFSSIVRCLSSFVGSTRSSMISLVEAILSAVQSISSHLRAVPSYIARPFIWTATEVLVPFYNWLFVDVVISIPWSAIGYTIDLISLLSKWTSRIWSIYTTSDNTLFLISIILLITFCTFKCFFGDDHPTDNDDNEGEANISPYISPEDNHDDAIFRSAGSKMNSSPSVRSPVNETTNNTRSDGIPRFPHTVTNMPPPTEREMRRLSTNAKEAAREEEERNRFSDTGNNGTEERSPADLPITPVGRDNYVTRASRSDHTSDMRSDRRSRPITYHDSPTPFATEQFEARTAEVERLASPREKDAPRLWGENIQQAERKREQDEKAARLREVRRRERLTIKNLSTIRGDCIKNTTPQPESTPAKGSTLKVEILRATDREKIEATVIKDTIAQTLIATDPIVQVPSSADPFLRGSQELDRKSLNKEHQKTEELGYPARPSPEVPNTMNVFEGKEDLSKEREEIDIFGMREEVRVLQGREKEGNVKPTDIQTSRQPELSTPTETITLGLKKLVIAEPDEKKDEDDGNMPGSGGHTAGGMRNLDVLFGGYSETESSTPERPCVSTIQLTPPRDTEISPTGPVSLVDNTKLRALAPKFRKSRKKEGSKIRASRKRAVHSSNINKQQSKPSAKPYDRDNHALPTTTARAVILQRHDLVKFGNPSNSPVEQYDLTRPGPFQGPAFQISQTASPSHSQPPVHPPFQTDVPSPFQSTVQQTVQPPVQPPVQSPVQSTVQGYEQFIIPGFYEPPIHEHMKLNVQASSPPILTDVPMKDVPPAPLSPPVDDGERMVIDGENESSNAATAPSSPFGSLPSFLVTPPNDFGQQPAAPVANSQFDDTEMGEDASGNVQISMGDSYPMPEPFGIAGNLDQHDIFSPAPSPSWSDSFSTGIPDDLNHLNVVLSPSPNPLGHPPTHGSLTEFDWESQSGLGDNNSSTNSWDTGLWMPTDDVVHDGQSSEALVGNISDGGQHSQTPITSGPGGNSPGPITNGFDGDQDMQGTTTVQPLSTQIFNEEDSIPNPGVESLPYCLPGPQGPSYSNPMTPSQRAKFMTQMINTAKGVFGEFQSPTVLGASPISTGTGTFPPATSTRTREPSTSNIPSTGVPPATTPPGAISTGRINSNTENDPTPAGDVSLGGIGLAYDSSSDAEKAEKAEKAMKAEKTERKAKARKEEEARHEKQLREIGDIVEFSEDCDSSEEEENAPSTPRRKILKPKGKMLTVNFLEGGNPSKIVNANTDAKLTPRPNHTETLDVAGNSSPTKETHDERQAREVMVKVEAQAAINRRSMDAQNVKMDFGTAEENAEWHETTGRTMGGAAFTQKDFERKKKDFERRKRKEKREAETTRAADALTKMMDKADMWRGKRDGEVRNQKDSLSSELTEDNEKKGEDEKTGEDEKKGEDKNKGEDETRGEDEESYISSIDSAGLAIEAYNVANNKPLQEEHEWYKNLAKTARDNQVDADDNQDDDEEANLAMELEKGLRED
jgi:hypothetical protein